MEVATQGNIYYYNADFAGDRRDVVAELVCVMRFWCPQEAKDGKSRATP
jgi:hypothetical protein